MPQFEWGPSKACRNLAKHGVAFEDAALVWDDPLYLLRFDRHEGGEERWHAIGRAGGVVVLVVWHATPDPEQPEHIRIIGARKATPRERTAYEPQADA